MIALDKLQKLQPRAKLLISAAVAIALAGAAWPDSCRSFEGLIQFLHFQRHIPPLNKVRGAGREANRVNPPNSCSDTPICGQAGIGTLGLVAP